VLVLFSCLSGLLKDTKDKKDKKRQKKDKDNLSFERSERHVGLLLKTTVYFKKTNRLFKDSRKDIFSFKRQNNFQKTI
jgi:hypothetical protein